MGLIAKNLRTRNLVAPSHVPVVTNGLQMFLDASISASYPGSGTTWTDISNNTNSGTLVNSPVLTTIQGAKTFAFDGVTNRVSFTYTIPVQSASTAFTWNAWVWPNRNSDGDVIMGYRGTTPLEFYKLTTQKFEMYPCEVYYQLPLNTWSNVCVVWNGPAGYPNNMLMYVNGVSVGLRDADTVPAFRATAMPFNLGGDATAGEYYNAYLAIAMIYNRALNSTEINQNFGALRSRFNK